MKHYFLLFTVCILFSGSVFSQQAIATKNADFFERNATMKSEFQNQKVVLFSLLNTGGNETLIINKLQSESKVFKFEMKKDGSCYAILDKTVKPEDLIVLLEDFNITYDIRTIKVFDKCFIDCSLPDDFPIYRNTSNPKADKNVYIQQIELWQKSNPELWSQFFAQ